MGFYENWCVIFMDLFLKDFGGTPEDAAAVFGNAGEESGGFKSLQEKKPLVPGSKGGYGIMQWTGPRRNDYIAYCSRNNLDPSAMMTNYKFLFVELSGTEKGALSKLFAAKGLEAKTESFMKTFLRPGVPHLNLRIQYAQRALKAWQDAQKTKDVEFTTEKSKALPESSVAETKGIWDMILDFILKILGKK